MKPEVLKLDYVRGDTETVQIRYDTLEVGPGVISFIPTSNELGHRTYVPLHRLSGFFHGTL